MINLQGHQPVIKCTHFNWSISGQQALHIEVMLYVLIIIYCPSSCISCEVTQVNLAYPDLLSI